MIVDGGRVNLPDAVGLQEHPEPDGSGPGEDGELAGEANVGRVVEAPLEQRPLVLAGGIAELGPLGDPNAADATVGVAARQGDARAEVVVAEVRQPTAVGVIGGVAGAFEDERGHWRG